VHAKSEASYPLKLLLAHRRTLKRKLLDIENGVRHSIKALGLMVGRRVQRATFLSRVREFGGRRSAGRRHHRVHAESLVGALGRVSQAARCWPR